MLDAPEMLLPRPHQLCLCPARLAVPSTPHITLRANSREARPAVEKLSHALARAMCIPQLVSAADESLKVIIEPQR